MELAETLTRDFSARLVLLYVRSRHLLPGPSPKGTSAPTVGEADRLIVSVPEEVRAEEMRQSLAIIEKGREQLERKGIKADYLIVEGDAVDELVKEASKDYDLLVCPIAVKVEESGLNNSALQKLANQLSCSILVVR